MKFTLLPIALSLFLCTNTAAFAGSAGDDLLMQDRWEAAIVEYRKALVGDPESTEIYFNLAIAYFQAGNLNHAAEALESLLRITPDDTEALYNLGCLRIRQKRISDAETCFGSVRSAGESAFKTCSTQALEWIRELKTAPAEYRQQLFLLLERLSAAMPGF